MLTDDFLQNEGKNEKNSNQEDKQKIFSDCTEDETSGNDEKQNRLGEMGNDKWSNNPVPLFVEQFDRLKTKVSPTEYELHDISLMNLNDDEIKHMEGIG